MHNVGTTRNAVLVTPVRDDAHFYVDRRPVMENGERVGFTYTAQDTTMNDDYLASIISTVTTDTHRRDDSDDMVRQFLASHIEANVILHIYS